MASVPRFSVRTLIVLFFLASSVWAQKYEMIGGRRAVANEVLVKYRSGTSPGGQRYAIAQHQINQSRSLGSSGVVHMRSAVKSAAQLVQELSQDPDVLYAEPNYVVTASDSPNDSLFSMQWDLQNTGQNGGVPKADIDAVDAWTISKGSSNVVVGVVDTGIDYNHPDLQANIWSAPAAFTVTFGPGDTLTCPAGSHGYDSIANTCTPMDQNNHGTHVAGTIGAAGNNATGVAGINWTTSMIALRFLDASGSGSVSNAIRTIMFAIQVKAAFPAAANVRVLSNSWGGSGYSQALLDAINQASAAGILFVVAAGNDGKNLDTAPSYPASYSASNLIAVAATDNFDALASYSNYSATAVSLGAPGSNIVSTIRNGSYGSMSGTSMATPHVSGAAALLLSACTLDTPGVKQALLGNVDQVASLIGKTSTGGRLNLYRALKSCSAPAGPGFTVAASPAALSLAPGGSASTSVTVAATGGFQGSVTLSVAGLPSGVTAAFSPAVVSSSGTSTLSVTASSTAAVASAIATVTATSGTITKTIPVTVAVQKPDFTLAAAPTSLSLAPGGSTTSTVSVSGTGGFQGQVALSVSGLPAGVTATFNPASITGSGASVLTLTAASSAVAGTASLTVTGTSSATKKTAAISVTVQAPGSFTLSATPAAVNLAQGSSGTAVVTVTPVNGFKRTVSLSLAGLPAGVSATFTPSSLLSGNAILTLTAASSAALGSTTLTLKGTSDSLGITVPLKVTITAPPSFTLTTSASALTVAPGGSVSSTLTVVPSGGFQGVVSFRMTGLPAGVTAMLSPGIITGSGSATLQFVASTAAVPGTAALTLTGTSGSLTRSLNLTLTVKASPGFSLATSAAALTVAAGKSGTSVISVRADTGFQGNVALTASGLHSGVTAQFSPASVAPGATSTLTLTAPASAAASNFVLTITGASGSIVRTANIAVTVTSTTQASFTLTASPNSLTVLQGGTASTTISATSVGGFTGTIQLSLAGLPPNVGLSFASSAAGSLLMNLTTTKATPAGTYTITLTGVSGTITKTATITVKVTSN